MTLKPVPARGGVPGPPDGLSDEMASFWRSVVDGWRLDEHHLQILGHACVQWDRAAAARRAVDEAGVATVDRFGQPREHPLLKTERDAMALHARLLRELDLDAAPAPSIPTKRGPRYR